MADIPSYAGFDEEIQLGYYSLSLMGTSHETLENGVCQDYSRVAKLENGWMLAAVADGLGSSAHSEIGSELAVNAVFNYFKENQIPAWDKKEEIEVFFRHSFNKALIDIRDAAEKANNSIDDYDTTLTALLYNAEKRQIYYLHVGDGGIITLNEEGLYAILTVAQKGDAFNEVVPLRADNSAWVFGESEEGICSILMMTDGIFDTACPPIYEAAKLEVPLRISYVRQFMDIEFMKNVHPVASEENVIKLRDDLKKFYLGSGTRGITDDKTILGIINVSVSPKEREPEYYKDPNLDEVFRKQQEALYRESERSEENEEKKQRVEEKADTDTIINPSLEKKDSDTDTIINPSLEKKDSDTDTIINPSPEKKDSDIDTIINPSPEKEISVNSVENLKDRRCYVNNMNNLE